MDLHLRGNVGGMSNRTTDQRLPTTSLVDRHVHGRERDKNAIVELLLGGEASNNDFSVISIVGMGGMGKTTLAQLVYNDDRVRACFDLRAWVCVSEDFDIFKITKTLLQWITSENFDFIKDLNSLQVKLKEKLDGKKFLIVLDDVWNENNARWEELCKPFTAGLPGCKLLVTTRNDGVVLTTGTLSACRLLGLSDEDCLSLLEKYALGIRNFDEFPSLKEIGVEIVKKCKGLPLAVQILGGLLRTTKADHDEWEAVLKSEFWDLPGDKIDILPVLKLSYDNLPSRLKLCFAYCSIFPRDYEFDKNQLVLLWMAEGFLDQPEGNKQIEDLGRQYFNDLLSRSFFQRSSADESRYVMHDLIYDLAQLVADDQDIRRMLLALKLSCHNLLSYHRSKWKVSLEWVFVVSNVVLELLSAVMDQLSSGHKPKYAQIGMLISLVAMLVCIIELVYKGRKERVQWRWRDRIPWFYYPSPGNMHFGTFRDIVGLACAISQFIVATINYSFSRRHADIPIKISVWPIIFAFGLLCSKLLENPNRGTPSSRSDP